MAEASEAYDDLLLSQRQLKEDVDFLESNIKTAIDYIFTIGQLSHNNEWRITAKERKSDWWQELAAQLGRINDLVRTVHNRLSHIRNQIDMFEDTDLLAKSWFSNKVGLGSRVNSLKHS